MHAGQNDVDVRGMLDSFKWLAAAMHDTNERNNLIYLNNNHVLLSPLSLSLSQSPLS
jgi:hypothetical protein